MVSAEAWRCLSRVSRMAIQVVPKGTLKGGPPAPVLSTQYRVLSLGIRRYESESGDAQGASSVLEDVVQPRTKYPEPSTR